MIVRRHGWSPAGPLAGFSRLRTFRLTYSLLCLNCLRLAVAYRRKPSLQTPGTGASIPGSRVDPREPLPDHDSFRMTRPRRAIQPTATRSYQANSSPPEPRQRRIGGATGGGVHRGHVDRAHRYRSGGSGVGGSVDSAPAEAPGPVRSDSICSPMTTSRVRWLESSVSEAVHARLPPSVRSSRERGEPTVSPVEPARPGEDVYERTRQECHDEDLYGNPGADPTRPAEDCGTSPE